MGKKKKKQIEEVKKDFKDIDFEKTVEFIPYQDDCFEIIKRGDLTTLKELVEKKPEILHTFGPKGYSTLQVASIYGHYQIVHYLLENGVKDSYVTLYMSCKNDEILQLLKKYLGSEQKFLKEELVFPSENEYFNFEKLCPINLRSVDEEDIYLSVEGTDVTLKSSEKFGTAISISCHLCILLPRWKWFFENFLEIDFNKAEAINLNDLEELIKKKKDSIFKVDIHPRALEIIITWIYCDHLLFIKKEIYKDIESILFGIQTVEFHDLGTLLAKKFGISFLYLKTEKQKSIQEQFKYGYIYNDPKSPVEVAFKATSNLKFITNDEKVFYTNSLIVCSKNDYFKTLIQGTFKIDTDEIILEEISSETFLPIIHHIYTNQIQFVNESNSIDVFIHSTKYNIFQLRSYAESIIEKEISLENFQIILQISDHYQSNQLKKACWKFISKSNEDTIQIYDQDESLQITSRKSLLAKNSSKYLELFYIQEFKEDYIVLNLYGPTLKIFLNLLENEKIYNLQSIEILIEMINFSHQELFHQQRTYLIQYLSDIIINFNDEKCFEVMMGMVKGEAFDYLSIVWDRMIGDYRNYDLEKRKRIIDRIQKKVDKYKTLDIDAWLQVKKFLVKNLNEKKKEFGK